MIDFFKIAPPVLLGVVLFFFGIKYSNQQAQLQDQKNQLKCAKIQISQLDEVLKTKDAVLVEIKKQADHDHHAYLQLQQKISVAHNQLHKRTQKLEALKRENQQLHDWAHTALPDVLIRLHQHPTIIGSHHPPLPEIDTLPASRHASADQ